MENPAKIFGFYPRKGILAPGSDADIVIFDPNDKWTVEAQKLHSRAKWTPYEGMEIKGRVNTTIIRGKIVFTDGKITTEKGYGQFIVPHKGDI
jgi:dihydropyrimidinase